MLPDEMSIERDLMLTAKTCESNDSQPCGSPHLSYSSRMNVHLHGRESNFRSLRVKDPVYPPAAPPAPLVSKPMGFSRQCCWRVTSSGMWRCVTGFVDPDVSKERSQWLFFSIVWPWRTRQYDRSKLGELETTVLQTRRIEFFLRFPVDMSLALSQVFS
jgi:hypothetical protein